MKTGLSKRKAVITGGSQGIGRAIAEALAAEGVSIAIVARNLAEMEKAAADITARFGVPVLPLVADLSSGADIQRAAATVAAHKDFGTINILVNNAGIKIPAMESPPLEWTEDKWLQHIQVKQMGALRMVQSFRSLLADDGTGRIITIAGASGTAVTARALITGMNNAALMAMSRYLADELAPTRVTANTISPGALASPDRMVGMQMAAKAQGVPFEQFVLGMTKKTGVVMRRLGELQEVADAAVYLASDSARYITGTDLRIDGGLTINTRRLDD